MTALLLDRPQWVESAACGGKVTDPLYDPWFAMPGTDAEKVAKRICRHCPVQQPCRDYAEQHGEPWGTWGGLTEYQRRRPEHRPINPGEVARRHGIEYGTRAAPIIEAQHADRLDDTMLATLVALLRQGVPRRHIATRLGVSRATVDRWCSRYRLWRIEASGRS